MPGFLNTLKVPLDNVYSLIDHFSKPNPKHIRNNAEYEIAHIRNKAVISIFLFMILNFTLTAYLNLQTYKLNILRSLCCVIVIFIQVISCKYHHQIFQVFITLASAAYGPIIVTTNYQGMQKVWFSALVTPIFNYVFTGSLWHFIFQSLIQAIYANTIYYSVLEEAVTFLPPAVFSADLTEAMNLALLYFVVVLTLIYYWMDKVFQRISIVEKKKDEFENQRTFLLGFSHELRNLINSLAGNVKLARLEALTERGKELLLNAEVCGELLLHLVNNILDTGKVEIGELEINPVPTRLYDTLEKNWGICSELIRMKNLKGKINIQKNLPTTVMIDHYRLTQIFLNLVGNAIKFTERGSIEMSVSWISHSDTVNEQCFQPYPFNYISGDDEGLFEKNKSFSLLDGDILTLDLHHRKIDRTTLQYHPYSQKGILKVVISDTGCGMSNEETAKLFQKFTQVTSDMSKRKLGTGLGLFITKQLCQRMQGEIRVFSQKDLGSSFIFCIPADVVQDENEHLHDLESMKNFLKSQNLKAMIVDDAPFNHIVLTTFFNNIGIETVAIASNGLEAYQKYAELCERGNRPDIVTMDLYMPVLDGKEAARKIRRFENEKCIKPCFMPIISGNCSESEIAECLNKKGNIKADAFLKKPASIEELVQVLGRHFIKKSTNNSFSTS